MNEKLEFYWYSLNKIMDHIRFSDTKATLFLSVYGIFISVVFTQESDVWRHLVQGSTTKMVLMLLAAVFSTLSIYFSFNTVNPRLKNPASKSLVYFGDVYKKFQSAEEYYQFGQEQFKDPDKVFRDLSDQVYVNSAIAYKKFYNVSWALRFFVLSIITFLVANFF